MFYHVYVLTPSLLWSSLWTSSPVPAWCYLYCGHETVSCHLPPCPASLLISPCSSMPLHLSLIPSVPPLHVKTWAHISAHSISVSCLRALLRPPRICTYAPSPPHLPALLLPLYAGSAIWAAERFLPSPRPRCPTHHYRYHHASLMVRHQNNGCAWQQRRCCDVATSRR